MTDEKPDEKPPAPPKTLDEKRTLARAHLTSQAKESRDIAKHYSAAVESREAFAAYCERRAATVETIEEVELDLMITQWRSDANFSRTRTAQRNEEWTQESLFSRYDAPPPAPKAEKAEP